MKNQVLAAVPSSPGIACCGCARARHVTRVTPRPGSLSVLSRRRRRQSVAFALYVRYSSQAPGYQRPPALEIDRRASAGLRRASAGLCSQGPRVTLHRQIAMAPAGSSAEERSGAGAGAGVAAVAAARPPRPSGSLLTTGAQPAVAHLRQRRQAQRQAAPAPAQNAGRGQVRHGRPASLRQRKAAALRNPSSPPLDHSPLPTPRALGRPRRPQQQAPGAAPRARCPLTQSLKKSLRIRTGSGSGTTAG